MLGKRRALRVKSTTAVNWSSVDSSVKGDGEAVNYSMTGIALVIYHDVNLPVGMELFIEPIDKFSTTLRNRKGRIAWFKKSSEGGIVKCQCGIEFVK